MNQRKKKKHFLPGKVVRLLFCLVGRAAVVVVVVIFEFIIVVVCETAQRRDRDWCHLVSAIGEMPTDD